MKGITTLKNPTRAQMVQAVLDQGEARALPNEVLHTRTPADDTGRPVADTFMVRDGDSAEQIDWNSKFSQEFDPQVFQRVWEESSEILKTTDNIELDRVVGADPRYALPVNLITPRALGTVFADNMFRSVPAGIEQSVLYDKSFTLIVLPDHPVEVAKYPGVRPEGNGKFLALDLENNRAVIRGIKYLGTIKKTLFTVMNYHCLDHDILPLHCAANEGEAGDVALILGLSGTGKTTLSAVPDRQLLGDDEHGWGPNGVANFEGGCYAKLVDLDPKKEPEIYNIACGHSPDTDRQGVIIENATRLPSGGLDLSDRDHTANARVSYPIDAMANFKPSSMGGHPRASLFLTADANGVLPPIAKLSPEQAKLWFLMGYTSKTPGTEVGVTEPKTTFSRFFGEPFLLRKPEQYTDLLAKKMKEYGTSVYLINTGWSGGPYGEGKRMDINLTRRLVSAAMSGELEGGDFTANERFHCSVPTAIEGVDSQLLDPKNTWNDKEAFEARANKLATEIEAKLQQLGVR